MQLVTRAAAFALIMVGATAAQSANIHVHEGSGPVNAEISVPVSIDITSLGRAAGIDAIDLNFSGSDPLLDIVRFDLNPALTVWQVDSSGPGLFTLFNFGSSMTGDFIVGNVVSKSGFLGDYLLRLDAPMVGNPTDVTGIDPSNPTNAIHFDLSLIHGTVSVVPEPSAIALLAIGALALFRRKSTRV